MLEPLARFTEILERTLEIRHGNLRDTDSSETIERWNSMVHMELITRLEAAFELRFALSDVIRAKTVRDLKELLRRNGVSLPTMDASP